MPAVPAESNSPAQATSAQPFRLRALGEFLAVAVCSLAFVFTVLDVGAAVFRKNAAGTRDFVEYWASGQQLAHHANPYDGPAILPIESAVGLPTGIPPMVMGNAPPTLLLVAPLGFVSAQTGEILWFVFLLVCFTVSVKMIRAMHGSSNSKRYYLGYAFAPALCCLAVGQLSLVILLGFVLFLRLRGPSPFLAGASLWFCMLKPQIFLPFGLVLLVWVITSKSYRLLAGAVSALLVTTAIAWFLDPHAWSQYHHFMVLSRYDKIPIPCLSIILRRIISPETMWLQYVPAAIGCVWALAYFRKHRGEWDWMIHGSPLILVSLLVAPYTWIIDQAVLLPAILHGAYVTRSRALLIVLALGSAVIEIAPLLGMKLLHSPFYLWTAPGWLLWYLHATRNARAKPGSESAAHLPTGALLVEPRTNEG